jgi:hypothetical protein
MTAPQTPLGPQADCQIRLSAVFAMIGTQGEAIRRLVELGLKAKGK